MPRRLLLFLFAAALGVTTAAQKDPTKPSEPLRGDSQAPATQNKSKAAPPPAKKAPDAESELQRAVEEAGNDRAALVRNLEDYLRRFPDASRKVQVYRALVESAIQLRDNKRALDYAERLIALRPEDASMMLFAIELLERAGDDSGLTRAVGYATRVLDRVEKAGVEAKPPRVSQNEWETEQKKLQMSVYLIRGRLQMARHNYDAAVTDLEKSYQLLPNAAAALHLGEVAELRKDYNSAIDNYLIAFILPDQYGVPVDRRQVRRKLGNLWQLAHGNENGLGERLLQTYDRVAVAETKPAETTERNKGISEPFAFILRRPDGAAPVKLADSKGKVIVLNFWATWCLPCRELEPLFEKVGRDFEDKSDVVFLAVNADEDEGRVKPYIDRERVRTTVVFSDGLDALMDIKAFPTLIVLDRAGKIVYRAQGFAPETFVEGLSSAIQRALAGTS